MKDTKLHVQVFSPKNDQVPVVDLVTTPDQWAEEWTEVDEEFGEPSDFTERETLEFDAVQYVVFSHWKKLAPRHRRDRRWNVRVDGRLFYMTVAMDESGECVGMTLNPNVEKAS